MGTSSGYGGSAGAKRVRDPLSATPAGKWSTEAARESLDALMRVLTRAGTGVRSTSRAAECGGRAASTWWSSRGEDRAGRSGMERALPIKKAAAPHGHQLDDDEISQANCDFALRIVNQKADVAPEEVVRRWLIEFIWVVWQRETGQLLGELGADRQEREQAMKGELEQRIRSAKIDIDRGEPNFKQAIERALHTLGGHQHQTAKKHQRRLLINPDPLPDRPGREEIIWSSETAESSFHTNLAPDLRLLGNVPDANRDAVWLATLVYIADRTVKRTRDWSRTIDLQLPVHDLDTWNRQADELTQTLNRLTSDVWTVKFEHEKKGANGSSDGGRTDGKVDLVCLLSGGADSLCGAVRALKDDEHGRPLFVSHWDSSVTASSQNNVIKLLKKEYGEDSFDHVSVRLGAAKAPFGGQVKFPDEPTRRSRSLLFIALGLAAAAAHDNVELWIPENGYASLNPPLTLERMGALSTRTTDPLFLERISNLLAGVGGHGKLTNPYADHTKGEMFKAVAKALGEDGASELLSESHSCAHQRLPLSYGRGSGLQCGACFGCLVRRAAFTAAGLEDRTDYLVNMLEGDDLDDFRKGHSQDFNAVRRAVARGVTDADVLSLTLPDDYPRDKARELMKRGLNELSAVKSL